MKTNASFLKSQTLLFSILLGVFASCEKEAIQTCATYEKDIKPLMEKSCSYSGCHSGTTAGLYVPAAAKDFTNYAGVKSFVDNGKLKLRTLEKADMPSPIYTPAGYPNSLTQEEKDMIQCWIENGAPEK